MKALFLTDSQHNNIEIRTIDPPLPKKGQALVALKAASLNHRDQWCREGRYPKIKYDTILGSDGAGIVKEINSEDQQWLGKRVIINPNINWGSNPNVQSADYQIIGMPSDGTFAEYIAVDIDRLHVIPDYLDFVSAAAIPIAGLTAFRAVFTQAMVQQGMRVFISGVGGGVAQFAMLFALAAGANVYVSSGSEEKLGKAKAMGITAGFNYKKEEWEKEALKESGGFDVVIDSAGGNQVNTLLKMLKPDGAYVFYGATNGLAQNIDLYRVFWNQIRLQGTTMGNDEEFRQLLAFMTKHQIKPIIDSVRPFEDIISAFDAMKAGTQFGKIVMTFN